MSVIPPEPPPAATRRAVRPRLLGAALSLFLLLPAVRPAKGQAPPGDGALGDSIRVLKAGLADLDDQIRRTDSLSRAEASRFNRLREARERDRERRREEIASLRSRVEEVRLQVEAEKRQVARVENLIGETEAREKAIRQRLAALARDLEDLVLRSLPWDKEERLDRVAALRLDLESGRASAEEAVGRLRALYRDAVRFGDEAVLANRPVTRKNGEVVNAEVLRIGNQWMVYADAERSRYGILERRRLGDSVRVEWREELSFPEREAVRRALEVKASKKPPQLVELPLSLSLNPADSADGEAGRE